MPAGRVHGLCISMLAEMLKPLLDVEDDQERLLPQIGVSLWRMEHRI